MHMPNGSLVCARCGELTPGPTGLPFDTRPPAEGPRPGQRISREVPIDRRGRGVRALGALGPMKVRPQQVQWTRGGGQVPDRRTRPMRPQPMAPEPAPAPLPSEIYQAVTDPHWVELPVSEPPEVSEVSEPQVGRASLWRRLGAGALDASVVGLATGLATLLALTLFGWGEVMAHIGSGFDEVVDGLLIGRGLGWVVLSLAAVFAVAYSVVGHALGGATLGKRLAGLKVVDAEGDAPGLWVSVWRTTAACVSMALGGLGFALALFDPQGLALHDHVVGTRVVDAEEEPA